MESTGSYWKSPLNVLEDDPEYRLQIVLANPQHMKSATARKLAGGQVTVELTERVSAGSGTHLVYHPRTLAMGVGCVLDLLAGAVKRAPTWMQRSGLEWAFRLGQEPHRLWRRYLLNDLPMF